MAFLQLRIAILSAIFASMNLAAQAKTYVATFTTGGLRPTCGAPGIAGVTRLRFYLYSTKPFQANFHGTWTGRYGFFDGINTLGSLTKQGYSVQGGYPFVIYDTDDAGNITDWYIRTNMPNDTVQTGINYYSFIAYSNYEGDNGADVVVQNDLTGQTYGLNCGLPQSASFSTKQQKRVVPPQ